MFTRRQVVSHGAIGALAASAMPMSVEAAPQDDSKAVVAELKQLEQTVKESFSTTFQTNTLSYGYVPSLRAAFTTFLKTTQKFPDFCEIGTGVFYDVYDWHVKNRAPLEMSRTADNRLTIKFMFTTLIVRTDQDSTIGVPFDRTGT